ncbi:MAG: hypothetical protein LBR15_03870 [Methanobrevibacter sp.]|nr:hypothetical protein [Candidatus Methanovirga australis]
MYRMGDFTGNTQFPYDSQGDICTVIGYLNNEGIIQGTDGDSFYNPDTTFIFINKEPKIYTVRVVSQIDYRTLYFNICVK